MKAFKPLFLASILTVITTTASDARAWGGYPTSYNNLNNYLTNHSFDHTRNDNFLAYRGYGFDGFCHHHRHHHRYRHWW